MQRQQLMRIWSVLKYTFVILPIAAGADKFFNLLVDWEVYLNPVIADLLPFSGSAFTMIVGVIEIAAGIIVLKWTRIGAYIVTLWLALISLNLILSGYFDIAVRDIVMAINASVLAQLTEVIEAEGVKGEGEKAYTMSG